MRESSNRRLLFLDLNGEGSDSGKGNGVSVTLMVSMMD